MKPMLGIAAALAVIALGARPALAAGDVPDEVLRVRDSVYRISTEDDEYEYSGSGFVVGSDGDGTYIATNYHVVEDTYEDSIMVIRHDGSQIRADIAAFDAGHDLCVLKTIKPIADARPLVLSDEASDTGDAVYALGFPGAGDYLMDEEAYRPEDVTVTDGIVSAVKHATIDDAEITFLQMNAAINPGSSGGPLVNGRGQVTGVNTLGILDANDMFAAVSVVHLTDLLDKKRLAYTGTGSFGFSSTTLVDIKTYIIIMAIIGTVSIALAGAFFLILRRRRMTLSAFMAQRPQPLSPDQVIDKLRPVFQVIGSLHERGEAHGSIHPDNLYVNQQGRLLPGRRRKHTALNAGTRPYLPMECYDDNAVPSPLSDVYALGAVMAFMLTGHAPDDVMTRLQQDTLVPRLREAGIADPLCDTLRMAMAPRKEARILDTASLIASLGLKPGFPVHVAMAPQPAAQLSGSSSRRKSSRLILLGSAALTVIALAAVVIIQEWKYQSAVTYASKWNFEQANDQLGGSISIYRGMSKLSLYVSAGCHMELGQYDKARHEFLNMGDYRDAQELVLECDYRKAHSLLNNGEYSEAKKLFTSLGKYADSDTWAMECDYRLGISQLDRSLYTDARKIFEQLSTKGYKDTDNLVKETDYRKANSLLERFINANPENRSADDMEKVIELYETLRSYSDAPQMLETAKAAAYDTAIALFDQSIKWYYYYTHIMNGDCTKKEMYEDFDKYKDALEFFILLPGYCDADMYTRTCRALNEEAYEAQYQKLYGLLGFEPANTLVFSDLIIEYFLEGTWKGDGKYFTLTEKSDEFHTTYNIPWFNEGKYYRIMDLIYYVGSDEDGWRKMFGLSVINENCIQIYAYKNGYTYTLYRQ